MPKDRFHFCRALTRTALLPLLLLVSPACLFAQAQPSLPKPDHIVIVIEENHGFSQIFGPGGSVMAPYMNQLAQQGALLKKFYSLHHPSQPNYVEIFSGSDQGLFGKTADDCVTQPFAAHSLGYSLTQAKLTFMGYAENLPGVGSLMCNTPCQKPPAPCPPTQKDCCYVRRHCPWTDFSDVSSNLSVPLSQFPTDFTQLPTVSFVIPDLNNDMHNGSILMADTWLKTNLDAYIQWAKSHNSLFVLTWDEDQNDSKPGNIKNHIGTLLVGAIVKPGSTSETTYTHDSLLRTIEDMYGLPLLGNSKGASDITGIWQPAPAKNP